MGKRVRRKRQCHATVSELGCSLEVQCNKEAESYKGSRQAWPLLHVSTHIHAHPQCLVLQWPCLLTPKHTPSLIFLQQQFHSSSSLLRLSSLNQPKECLCFFKDKCTVALSTTCKVGKAESGRQQGRERWRGQADLFWWGTWRRIDRNAKKNPKKPKTKQRTYKNQKNDIWLSRGLDW